MARAEIYDDSHRLLAAAQFLSFVCRKTGSGTTASPTGPTNSSNINIPISGYTLPMVAIIVSGGYAAARNDYGNISGVPNFIFACNAPVGTAYTYYIFDWTADIPSPSGKMRMYRDDHTCSFDSDKYHMLGAGSIDMNYSGFGPSITKTGRSLAPAFLAPGGHYMIGFPYCTDGVGGGDLETCSAIQTTDDGKRYGARVTNSGQTIDPVAVSYSDTTGIIGDYAAYQAGLEANWQTPTVIFAVDVTGIPLNTTFF